MRKRVLVADDDLTVRESLKKLLEESGYDAVVAADGEEAVSKFSAGRPDLLLLDLEMPKQDGWDVLELIGGSDCVVPVIVLTGRLSELDTRLIPGVAAMMEKPVEPPVLLKRVEELVAGPSDGAAAGADLVEARETPCGRKTDGGQQ